MIVFLFPGGHHSSGGGGAGGTVFVSIWIIFMICVGVGKTCFDLWRYQQLRKRRDELRATLTQLGFTATASPGTGTQERVFQSLQDLPRRWDKLVRPWTGRLTQPEYLGVQFVASGELADQAVEFVELALIYPSGRSSNRTYRYTILTVPAQEDSAVGSPGFPELRRSRDPIATLGGSGRREIKVYLFEQNTTRYLACSQWLSAVDAPTFIQLAERLR